MSLNLCCSHCQVLVQVYKALRSGVQVVAAKVFQDRDPSSSGSSLPSSRASTVRSDVFKQEIAILKSCHDRNIVQFIGACLQPDCTIMVMEYLEGGDLYHAIANDSTGRFSWYRRYVQHLPAWLHCVAYIQACAGSMARYHASCVQQHATTKQSESTRRELAGNSCLWQGACAST